MYDVSKLPHTNQLRARLDFAEVATFSCTASKVSKLARLPKAATRFVVRLQWISYEDRLYATGLSPEVHRGARGDLI